MKQRYNLEAKRRKLQEQHQALQMTNSNLQTMRSGQDQSMEIVRTSAAAMTEKLQLANVLIKAKVTQHAKLRELLLQWKSMCVKRKSSQHKTELREATDTPDPF